MVVSCVLEYEFGIETVAAGSFENVLIIAVCQTVVGIHCLDGVFSAKGVFAENICRDSRFEPAVVAEIVDADEI